MQAPCRGQVAGDGVGEAAPDRGALCPARVVERRQGSRTEHRLEHGQRARDVAGPYDEVPERLELLPARGIGEVTEAVAPRRLRESAPEDRAPAVEVPVGPPVPRLELLRPHAARFEHDVPRVVEVPVAVPDAAVLLHAIEERRARIGREDVEGRGLDPLLDGPAHGAVEDTRVVLVHAEDEAAVHHHAQAVQPPDRLRVVAVEVLDLALGAEARGIERLEADEEAAQARLHRLLEQRRLQDRAHGPRRLPDALHPPHPLEERRGEAHVAEQVIVQEVEVAAGKARDLGERLVHALRVEALASLEEGLLVAEVAGVRAASRHHDGVRAPGRGGA